MIDDFQRVQVLSEALSIINGLSNRIIVVKYGGAAMRDNLLKTHVVDDILLLSSLGVQIVLVHGGGPAINSWLKKINIKPKFHNGIRITDQPTMEIVEMVLVGKVNKDLVALFNRHTNSAIGLSGKDSNLIVASPLFASSAHEDFVGKIERVNIKILQLLLSQKYIPVIASVATGHDGRTYNVNADTVASSIAVALKAEKLVLMTDTPGIMYDIQDQSTLLKHLSLVEAQKLKSDNVISGGMIPKVDCSISALQSHVRSAHIIDGRVEHALLLEVLTKNRIGSMLTL